MILKLGDASRKKIHIWELVSVAVVLKVLILEEVSI